MNGPAAFRPTDARRIRRTLAQLGTLWQSRTLAGIGVELNPRLRRTLGRLLGQPWRIELSPKALATSTRLREILTHESAHAALATKAGPTHSAPHGPEWRRLMAAAGYPTAKGAHWGCHSPTLTSSQPRQRPKVAPPRVYEHWCPVCQSSRLGRRPVKAWRCAPCVAAGLDGTLEITRRPRRPTTAR
jgi:predicted SprT family Zn-dependent metalloprotease